MANELDIKIKAKFIPCAEEPGFDYHFDINVGYVCGDLYVTGSTPREEVGGQIIGRIISILARHPIVVNHLLIPPVP